jgi:hypothetical protein
MERVYPLPCGQRRIELAKDMPRVAMDAIRKRWRAYYGARDTTIVLAGDVRVANARQLAKRLFGAIPTGESIPSPPSLPATLPGRVVREFPWPKSAPPIKCYAWAAPRPESADFAPFLILAARMACSANAADGHKLLFRYWPLSYDIVALTTQGDEDALDQVLASLAAPLDREIDLRSVRDRYGLLLGLRPPDDMVARQPGHPISLPETADDLCTLAFG